MSALHALWESWQEKVTFVVVYIREAHPEEGWVVTPNRDEGILINDPTSTDERVEVAAACAINLQIRIPVVVDEVADEIALAYGALPDRLYLVGQDGSIVYQGDPGPFGFDPNGLEEAIVDLVGA